MEMNIIPLKVFQKCRNQHIVSMSGPVDLDFRSVISYMDLIGVEEKERCFELVHAVYTHFLRKQREERELEKENK